MLTLSTTTATPSTSKTWSSSLAWSKASAYWKPEQPPPRTATRSAWSGESSWPPSSSPIFPAALPVSVIASLEISVTSQSVAAAPGDPRRTGYARESIGGRARPHLLRSAPGPAAGLWQTTVWLGLPRANCGRLRQHGLPPVRADRRTRHRDDQPLRLDRRRPPTRVRDRGLRRLLRAAARLRGGRDDLAALDRRLRLGLRAAARGGPRSRLDPHLGRHLRHLQGGQPGPRSPHRRGQGRRADQGLRLALGGRRDGTERPGRLRGCNLGR